MPSETLTSPARKWYALGPQQCLVGTELIQDRTDCGLGHCLFIILFLSFLHCSSVFFLTALSKGAVMYHSNKPYSREYSFK